ncbi:MAG: sulfate ABC transporter ATP-binding protein [Deltaproteobacteria bacterium]|nr:sulfate ABC transporter ATP-binding protein [Deltaproteobacteria bacterium]
MWAVGLTKSYGPKPAVEGVSFDVGGGELVALLGPSGSGKSTILRIIAGLERAERGEVWMGGQRVDHLHAKDRGIGFVFQHYALFRHMTVAENVAFGLWVRKVPERLRRKRAGELLEVMGLDGLGSRYPSQLSGGQRQRVALARALAPEPSVLLLDEPFAAVDAKVRAELRRWLRRLHDELHVTSLFVTHDQDEAFALADRVIIVHSGRLEQAGTPEEILDHPKSEVVARFVGDTNVLSAEVVNRTAKAGALEVPLGEDVAVIGAAHLVIRSHDLKLWRADPGVASVRRMVSLGDRVRVDIEIDGAGPLHAQFPRRSSLLHGVEVGVRVQVEVTLARVYGSPAK